MEQYSQSQNSVPAPEARKLPALGAVSPGAASVEIDLSSATIRTVPPAIVLSALTPAEIDSRMLTRGFPEMRKHWNDFKSLGVKLEDLSFEQIGSERTAHMRPLLGRPGVALPVAAAVAGAGCLSYVLSADFAMGPWTRVFYGTGMAIAFSTLGSYATSWFQRYCLHPMRRIMARDLACMLKERDFRGFIEKSGKAQELRARLSQLGVNAEWDNPSYRAFYFFKAGRVSHAQVQTASEFVQQALREYLGYKDPLTRKFCGAAHFAALREGKATIAQFVRLHRDEIEANKQAALPTAEARRLLQCLHDEALVPGSPGAERLLQLIKAFDNEAYAPAGVIKAEIWKRDPWVDLTHQEEFYSSASLRGCKALGAGPKGRLGTFGYLRSPGITALDFTINKGRVVRARLAAAVARGKDGGEIAVLFVDGVEGSNALAPRVAAFAIEEYARSCGFGKIFYNHYVHNQTPRAIVSEVAGNARARFTSCRLSYLDASERQYLDSFGLSIDPFEYARPAGRVTGYIIDLDGRSDNLGEPPSRRHRAWQTIRRNSHWIVNLAPLGAPLLFAWHSLPEAIMPLGLLASAWAAGQWWHQRRSRHVRMAENAQPSSDKS